MNIVLLGVPSSGKGTQAELLTEKLYIPQISTGQLFRKQIEEGTEHGKQLKAIMDSGELIPDNIVLEVFEKRIVQHDCASGAILDGFPRTINQAQHLEDLYKKLNRTLNQVFYISLPLEVMLKRITGRWICRESGHSYHTIFNPPQVKGVCDEDGSELYQREDQKEEAVKERIHIYNEMTAPLIGFYKNKGLLAEINGDRSIDDIHKEILEIITTKNLT